MKKSEYIEKHGEEGYEAYLERQRERQKKEAFIERHGEEAWEKRAERKQKWNKVHHEAATTRSKNWALANPEKVKERNQEGSRKGGKRYDKMLVYERTGLRGERNGIRAKHGYQWRPYKMIIAPDSQIHHEWVPNTSDYRGLALVEANQHMHGFVDVIEILEGKITLLTEEEVKRGTKNEN